MELYEYVTINELCLKITDGAHFSPSEEQNGIYPMYSSKDMLYNGFDDKDVKMISKADYDRLVKQDCRPLTDDVLIIKDGNNYLKQIFKVKSTLDAVILSSIAILRPNKKHINPDYFTYVLRTGSVRKAMANYVSGAAIPRVVLKDFKKMKLRIHKDVHIQHNIASILSAYDNLIENNNKRIRLLEQMAENLYKEWFVRFRFPGHEKADFENGLPKGWKIIKLGEFITFERGVGYGSKDIADGENVLLSMNNIRPYGGFIRDYSRPYSGKYKEFQKVKNGDLIMSITDMTQDRRIIGYTGIVPPGKDNRIICTHLMKLSSQECHSYFLDGLFNYSNLSRVIAERATGANVLGLTADILKGVKTLLPPKQLQSLYVSKVIPIIEECFSLQDANDNLSRQRDLLLPRLMSGKLEVKE